MRGRQRLVLLLLLCPVDKLCFHCFKQPESVSPREEEVALSCFRGPGEVRRKGAEEEEERKEKGGEGGGGVEDRRGKKRGRERESV